MRSIVHTALLSALLVAPLVAQDRARELEELRRSIAELSARLDHLGNWVEHASLEVTEPAERLAAFREHESMVARTPHDDVAWRFLGPTNVSGRVTDVAVATPRGVTYRIYAATASGGVWKSENDGTSWEPIFDQAVTTSIGALGLDPNDPDRLWVGTGEANIFRSSMAGAGVWLTTDGGETWEHKGLAATHTIARIVVHPADPDVVYVAASGHEWTDSHERGVYRTTDGGKTWEHVLFVDPGTGAIDLVMDPMTPWVLYAATWERRRKLWNDPRNDEQTKGSGIWWTGDAGTTWQPLNEGLPEPRHRGRIGIDLCHAEPNVLYAFVDHYEEVRAEEEEGEERDSYGRLREGAIRGAVIYRSDSRDEPWRQVSADDRRMQRLGSTYGWVFGQIRVDPTDPETIYVMGLGLNVSNDGGATFRSLRGMHGDHHALWIDPENPRYLINGNDGGTAISHDAGEHWQTSAENLPAVQFYNLAFDSAEPFHVYGSVQDHGCYRREIDLRRGFERLRATEWERAPGGEASHHAVDPTDPATLYAEGFYGSIFRTDLDTSDRARIAPRAEEGEEELRGQWLAPFILSPHNPRILYHGMNRVFRSLDRGERFEPISPDLTTNDPRRRGDIPYQTITSLSESSLRFGLLYAGTDDGRLHRTDDSGGSWQEIGLDLAPERWISRVIASRWEEDRVWCAQNGKRNDDFGAYLWRSEDRGETWRDVAVGLPFGPVNVVREDPVRPDLVYVGTDVGVYVSTDRGVTWEVLGAELPSTYVHDLEVHPEHGLLVIATHGRGMWALDVRGLQGVLPPEEEEDDDE